MRINDQAYQSLGLLPLALRDFKVTHPETLFSLLLFMEYFDNLVGLASLLKQLVVGIHCPVIFELALSFHHQKRDACIFI